MESGDSEKDASHSRRSTRQSSKTVLFNADLKPRPPLKRSRKAREDEAASRAVNVSKEPKSLAKGDDDDDGVSPVKIQKLQEAENAGGGKESGDGFSHTYEADVEMDENVDQDEDMNSEAEQDHGLSVKSGPVMDEKHPNNVWQVNPETKPILRSRRSFYHKTVDPEPYKPKTQANYSSNSTVKDFCNLTAVPVQLKSLENQQEVLQKRSSIKYQDHKEEKARDALRVPVLRSSNRYPPPSEPHSIHGYQTNNFPIRKQPPYPKIPELKKPVIISKASPASTSRGCAWYICKWFLVIGLLALGLLGYQKFQDSLSPTTDEVQAAAVEKFDVELAALQLLFPSQRSVFWTRSRKHLKRHLQTLNPTEPVSLILTSGFKAERTLGCLARRLAAVYSTSLNSSIIEIDGTTKTAQDSDQVKLDIDTVLREAFGGNKSAAVIHRFEELPPGSTLIFYRYCDHENAAYKNVSLVFTVMLNVDTIDTEASLSVVEDMIYEKIKGKFVLKKSATFNQMDVDKLSGLWSRISHLILPVASEEKFEQQGCEA